jgi:hypothetical protein
LSLEGSQDPVYKGSRSRVIGVEILPDPTKPRLCNVFVVVHITDPIDFHHGSDLVVCLRNISHLRCFPATEPPG